MITPVRLLNIMLISKRQSAAMIRPHMISRQMMVLVKTLMLQLATNIKHGMSLTALLIT